MYEYRVTKFDKAKRGSDGAYLDQTEWTSVADIGKPSSGSVLTVADYLRTEARYVSAIHRFFAASGLTHLRVIQMSDRYAAETLDELKNDQPELYSPVFTETKYAEDQPVNGEQITHLAQQNLRGILECSLECNGQFFVHFGWDYYMYIGCQAACETACQETETDGLFVEEFVSPYRRPDNFTAPAKILVSDKLVDTLTVDDLIIPYIGSEIPLPTAELRQLRQMFGLSDEHPFYGHFDINQAVAEKLTGAFDLSLDLERCSYTLDTTDG